jgi:hypothetical protein
MTTAGGASGGGGTSRGGRCCSRGSMRVMRMRMEMGSSRCRTCGRARGCNGYNRSVRKGTLQMQRDGVVPQSQVASYVLGCKELVGNVRVLVLSTIAFASDTHRSSCKDVANLFTTSAT